MVKLTAPLLSHFAHGTLGSELQFRQHSSGPIALAKRPRAIRLPLALASNAQIVRIAQQLTKEFALHEYDVYKNYARLKETTSRAAYLHFALDRWRRFAMIPFDDPYFFDTSDPTGTVIVESPFPDPGYANLTFLAWNAADMTTLHLLFTPTETPGPQNCIHAHTFQNPEIPIDRPRWMTEDYWLQACTWIIAGDHPTLSPKLHIGV